jgi:prolipoprotein diacylglyceryltransferase/Fe-S-cluster containining protein
MNSDRLDPPPESPSLDPGTQPLRWFRAVPDRAPRQPPAAVYRRIAAARPARDTARGEVAAVPLDRSEFPDTDPRAEPPARVEPGRLSTTQQMRREVARGLRYAHFRANANTSQLIRLVSAVEAATGLLEERGLIDRGVLEQRTAEAAERVGCDFAASGLGVRVDPSTASKYDASATVGVDCENRLHLCHAACCKLHFALSREDLQEGTIRWDFGNPYLIAQGEDGWCVHLDRRTRACGAYAARPRMCRTYDCSKDPRIWLDFERRIVNPQILDAAWPQTAPSTLADDAAPARKAEPAGDVSLRRSLLDALASRPQVWRHGRWFLSAYGICLALGFTAGTALWLSRVGSPDGSGPTWLFVGGLVLAAYAGSRLLWMTEARLGRALSGARAASGVSGHTFYGGLLGALGFSAIWMSGHGTAWRAADLAAPSVALGLAIGKLGCFGTGCCVGSRAVRGPAVRYFHRASKAVAVHHLAGVPLIPVQLYESAYAAAAAIALWSLPDSWVGSGRVLGALLVLVTLGRAMLLPFRHRSSDARATALLTGVVHLLLVTAGTLLLVRPSAGAPFDAAPLPAWSVVAGSLLAGSLVLALFGVHRQPSAAAATESGGKP